MLYEVSTRRKIIHRFFHLQINKTMLESWMSVGHQGVFWLWQLLYCLCWTANSTCGVHVHDVFDDFSCGKQWKQPISHSFSEFQGWSSSSLKSFQDAKILDHFQWDIDCISPSLCLHQFPIGRSRLWTIAIHRHRECSDCWYVFLLLEQWNLVKDSTTGMYVNHDRNCIDVSRGFWTSEFKLPIFISMDFYFHLVLCQFDYYYPLCGSWRTAWTSEICGNCSLFRFAGLSFSQDIFV